MLLIQVVMLLTGGLMIAAPEACTRRDARGDKTARNRTRTMGIWLAAAALIWLFTANLLNL
ncbi:MAG: permease [Roseburia sp.]